MRVVQFIEKGEVGVGVEVDGAVKRTPYRDTRSLIEDGQRGLDALKMASISGEIVNIERLLAPITNPGKMFGSGVNYRSHGDEEPGFVFPDEVPWDFIKLSSAIIGSNESIVIPPTDDVIRRQPGGAAKFSEFGFAVDYEAELGVVIGRRAKNVKAEDAHDYIWGFTIVNDVGARSVQFHNAQKDLAKNFDTFCPMGPRIVTLDELPDYGQILLECLVNGEMRQSVYIKEQIVGPMESIEWISSIITLEPGDVLITGTPAGCGTFMTPPKFLEPGDVVECRASGIGTLVNRVVAGSTRTRPKSL
jgi:2-keto-4-pentenoate hydratase/2-oxohepta-3-ene-1,7-dioic acid hydratase in catechol pathway